MNANVSSTTSIPPQDLDSEKALLGSILLVANSLDDVGATVTPEDFYVETHGKIFSVAREMYGRNKSIDPVTVAAQLLAAGENRVGVDFLIELFESVPHAAHAKYYAGLVAEKSQRRNLIAAGHRAMQLGHDPTCDIDDSIAESEAALNRVLERRSGTQTTDLKSILIDAMQRIEGGKSRGLLTGYPSLDGILNGFEPGNLVIVGARPSIGKTAFAINIARQVAEAGNAVGLISLEQSRAEIAERLLSIEARFPVEDMRRSALTEAQCHDLLQAAQSLSDRPIVIDDCEYRGIAAIEASARLMVRRSGIKLLIIDFLQLITGQSRRESREQEVAEVSGRLKWLAKSLAIPVIALAQINRENEKRTDKRPKLSDLRESGSIEQDADVVLLLHRDEYYEPTHNPGEALVIIAKHRNGRTGDVKLQFENRLMQFRELAPGYAATPSFGGGNEEYDSWGLPKNP